MGLRLHNRLSAERYLSNKEHFDQGLIDALVYLDNRVIKLTDEISIHEANKHIMNSRHRKQIQKLSRMEVENHNLKGELQPFSLLLVKFPQSFFFL